MKSGARRQGSAAQGRQEEGRAALRGSAACVNIGPCFELIVRCLPRGADRRASAGVRAAEGERLSPQHNGGGCWRRSSLSSV